MLLSRIQERHMYFIRGCQKATSAKSAYPLSFLPSREFPLTMKILAQQVFALK